MTIGYTISMTTVSELIQHLVESGRTETEIAARLGVSQSTVGRWRRGERTPPLGKLVVSALRWMIRSSKN